MKSVGAVILAIFAILLFASTTTESRNVPRGEYWREVMKDSAMPKVIKSLTISHTTKSIPNVTVYPKDDRIDFTDDFEPVPYITAYPEDPKVINGHAKDYKSFSQEFEPSPNLSVYNE